MSKGKAAAKLINRPRGYRLQVWVTEEEKAQIESQAQKAGMSSSAFLRAVGTNAPIKSVVDMDAVKSMVKVNGDMGRIAGLLKLWLADKRGIGAHPMSVEAMMKDFRILQKEMMNVIGEAIQ